MSKKICSLCKKGKTFSKFYHKKGGAFGLDSKCKDCVALYHKKYFQKNKSEILLNRQNYMVEYRESNKEKISEYNKKYYDQNRKQILKHKKSKEYRKHSRRYEKNKRKNDISFRIMGSLRSRLNLAIKNNTKHGKTKDLIGCSIDFLKEYLSNMFQEGMSWNNYGKNGWHIDHIMPCSSFDLTILEQQKLCFHYSNLQPLWAKENISKSNKIL